MLLKIISQRIFILKKKIKHITNDMYTITNTSCGVATCLRFKMFTGDATFKDTDSLEGTASKLKDQMKHFCFDLPKLNRSSISTGT